MKTYRHAWLALMAGKRLEETIPFLPKSHLEAGGELSEFKEFGPSWEGCSRSQQRIQGVSGSGFTLPRNYARRH